MSHRAGITDRFAKAEINRRNRRYGACVIEPPPTLDGARVLAVADLSGTTATGSVRHFRSGQRQDGGSFAYLVLAAYEHDSGCYVFYCDEAWEVQNDLLYASRADAEEQVRREFVGVTFRDV